MTSTTDFEARNFGMAALPDPETRYDRGDEMVEACRALLDCRQWDALVLDKEAGFFAHPDKVTRANCARTAAPRHMSPRVREHHHAWQSAKLTWCGAAKSRC